MILKLVQLGKTHSEEISHLAELTKSLVPVVPVNQNPQKTFSLHGMVKPHSNAFFVKREASMNLCLAFRSEPLFTLIHGPRRSRKSSLLHEIIGRLDFSSFVYAKVDTISSSIKTDDALWEQFGKILSGSESPASPEVRKAAKKWAALLVNSRPPLLLHLFNQDYSLNGQKRKLIVFWDEYDAMYKHHELRRGAATALRDVRNIVDRNRESLPSFGGLVCLGAYLARMVIDPSSSSPYFDVVRDHHVLDFTLDETTALLQQYQSFKKVEVSPEVAASIQELTGGHCGLVSVCGRFMQDKGGNFDLQRWKDSIPDVIT